MPMKQINLDGHPQLSRDTIPKSAIGVIEFGPLPLYGFKIPYIQRYYAGTFRDGSDLWLHRFLSNDGDRHLHSHPFEFSSVMLCGGYTEEFLTRDGSKDHRVTLPNPDSKLPELLEEFLIQIKDKMFKPMSFSFLSLAGGSSQSVDVYDWHRIAAINNDTWTAVIVKPQRLPKWFFKDDNGDVSDMKASPRDWWKNYKARPDCDIALDDNHV
jgi:hypothetical protein